MENCLKQHAKSSQLKRKILREKNNALQAFIYKARRASKKVVANLAIKI
jgi:hypothetical protein